MLLTKSFRPSQALFWSKFSSCDERFELAAVIFLLRSVRRCLPFYRVFSRILWTQGKGNENENDSIIVFVFVS